MSGKSKEMVQKPLKINNGVYKRESIIGYLLPYYPKRFFPGKVKEFPFSLSVISIKEEGYVPKPKSDKIKWLEEILEDAVNQIPLPDAFYWSVEEVANWISTEVGFPQYAEAFRKNLISGRKLVMVSASSLPKMGICYFDDILVILGYIRKELNLDKESALETKPLNMPFRSLHTLYLQYRSNTGIKYERTGFLDFLLEKGIITRGRPELECHWSSIDKDEDLKKVFILGSVGWGKSPLSDEDTLCSGQIKSSFMKHTISLAPAIVEDCCSKLTDLLDLPPQYKEPLL